MFLKYLEIQGFKSFPDKTRLNFGKGFTAVVGPNGSGKSNISDAMRWVMGEQSSKTLRGAKMEDVIFGGTKARKPMSFAEVSICIDNTAHILAVDSDEVVITRKYYRSGESEYKINQTNVRLKDVHELLMDTGLGKDGYSIIGQGRIAEIVSAKSAERREIFEEAAGISKYKYRKAESEKKLLLAEENLVRLHDNISGLEERIGPLEIQSEKAKKYLSYAADKKRLEVSLWISTLEKSKEVLRDQENKILICQNDYDDFEDQLSEFEEKINNVYADSGKIQTEIENLRKNQHDLEEELLKSDSNIAVLNNDISHNNESIERLKNDAEQNSRNTSEILALIDENKIKIDAENKNIAEITDKKQALEQALMQVSTENIGQSEKLEAIQRELNDLTLKLSETKIITATSKTSIDENQNRLNLLISNNETNAARVELSKKELADIRKFIAELNEKSEGLKNSLNGYGQKLNIRSKKLDEVKNKLSDLDLDIKGKKQKIHLLTELEKNMEGYNHSVKTVMKASSNGVLKGIHGPVSQLLKAQDKYALAIETALGGAMQNIVVDSEEDAKRSIRMLKEQNGGRATFLPITSVKGNRLTDNLTSFDGFVGVASDLVSYDKKYEGIINSLLGRIAICEDLDSASFISKKLGYKFRIVTLDGQVINAGGSFTGGSASKTMGVISRSNEIERLKKQVTEQEAVFAENHENYKNLSNEVSKLNAECNAINSEILTVNEDLIKSTSEEKRVLAFLEDAEKIINNFNSEHEQLTSKIAELEAQYKDASNKQQSIETSLSQKEEELQKISGEKSQLAQKHNELSETISGYALSIVEAKKDVENLTRIIEDLTSRITNHDEKNNAIDDDIKAFEQKNAEILAQIEEIRSGKIKFTEQIKSIDEKISELANKKIETEGSINKIRAEEKDILAKKEDVSKDLVRLEEKKASVSRECDEIIKKLWDEYELTRSEAENICVKLDNITQASKELAEVNRKIKALGSVNIDAIEEYKDVSERYNFLKTQIDDVEKSRDELRKLIFDLTAQMRDMFITSFNDINRNFAVIFKELFGGGRGELKLTEDEDVLECGIEIFVEPPGKIIKNLSALSGGEQAFVAIAIYFAILRVRPAAFCLLDEIEAALDDVNVNKYAQYLHKMNDNTQFITITHRRGTMEAADLLYGVTMQEEGVSKLLELKVTEIEAQLGIK